jgi:hypothetical protein
MDGKPFLLRVIMGLLLISGAVRPAHTDGADFLSVIVPDTSGIYASSMLIPVRVGETDGMGIVSAEVRFSYDGDLLTAVGVDGTNSLLTPSWSLDMEVAQGIGTPIDTARVTMGTVADTLLGAGELFEISFVVADWRSPASSLLTADYVLFNEGTPQPLTASASFVLTGSDGQIRTTAVAQPGDTVLVRVIDADLDGSTAVAVENGQTGEVESILLQAVSAGDSHFFGRLFTSSQVGVVGDSALLVRKGDMLTVTYADALTAVGGTADRMDDSEVVNPFGDADGDGQLRAFDAAQVLKHRLAPFLSGLDSLAANVDDQAPFGPIDPWDASLVLKKRVGLIDRFPVQADQAANHPQPGGASKPVADERLLTLRMENGWTSVWTDEREGIVAGELRIAGMAGRPEMAEEMAGFLSAWHVREGGIEIVFAGVDGVGGPGELVRVYGDELAGEAELAEARLNGGRMEVRIGTAEKVRRLPSRFALHANAPNPFNPETAIRFELPEQEMVRLELFNVLGQKVRTLVDEKLRVGGHRVIWDGRNEAGEEVGSGVFFYRLEAGEFVQVRRMLLLK